MGAFKTTMTLQNAADVSIAERGLIKAAEVRSATVDGWVDTGAFTLAIDETLRDKLGLRITHRRLVTVANGVDQECAITEGVNLFWKDRQCLCEAAVMPPGSPILFGAMPLEQLDLVVYPKAEQLVGRHGDKMIHLLLGFKAV
jgi:hypothetical protein